MGVEFSVGAQLSGGSWSYLGWEPMTGWESQSGSHGRALESRNVTMTGIIHLSGNMATEKPHME